MRHRFSRIGATRLARRSCSPGWQRRAPRWRAMDRARLWRSTPPLRFEPGASMRSAISARRTAPLGPTCSGPFWRRLLPGLSCLTVYGRCAKRAMTLSMRLSQHLSRGQRHADCAKNFRPNIARQLYVRDGLLSRGPTRSTLFPTASRPRVCARRSGHGRNRSPCESRIHRQPRQHHRPHTDGADG